MSCRLRSRTRRGRCCDRALARSCPGPISRTTRGTGRRTPSTSRRRTRCDRRAAAGVPPATRGRRDDGNAALKSCRKPYMRDPTAVPCIVVGAYGEWERQRESQRAAKRDAEHTEKPKDSAHQSILDIQRQAGNQAVSAMLRELSPNSANPEADIAVSGDQHAEHEADKIADAAVG